MAYKSIILEKKHLLFTLALLFLVSASAIAQPLNVYLNTTSSPILPGQVLQQRVTVYNSGSNALEDVVIALRQPSATGLSEPAVDAEPAATCSTGGRFCAADQFVRWQIGTLLAGQRRTVLFAIPLLDSGAFSAPTPGSDLDLEARVSAIGIDELILSSIRVGDPEQKLLRLSLTTDRDAVAAGSELTYTIRLSNGSETAADPQSDNTTLTLSLPDGVSVLDPDGATTVTEGLRWELGALARNTSGVRRARIRINDPSELTTLTASAALQDNNDRQASAIHTVAVMPVSPLQLSLNATPDLLFPGQVLRQQATVYNSGSDTLEDVVVALRQPPSTESIDIAVVTEPAAGCSSGGRFCAANQFARWQIGSLAAGQRRTVLFSTSPDA